MVEDCSTLLEGDETAKPVCLDDCINIVSRRFIAIAILPLALGNAADAVEILSAGYIMSVFKDQDGNGLTSTEKQLLTAAVFFGMLLGGLVVGAASDRVGRRPCLAASLFLNCLFGTLSAFAPSVTWLIAARIVAGIGVGGSIPTVFTLGAELFPAHIRGALLSVIASFWMVGSVYAASLAWILLGDSSTGQRVTAWGTWRHYALGAAFPAALALALTLINVPESPRFLNQIGRRHEAISVLRHQMGVPFSAENILLPPIARIQDVNNDLSSALSYSGFCTPDSQDTTINTQDDQLRQGQGWGPSGGPGAAAGGSHRTTVTMMETLNELFSSESGKGCCGKEDRNYFGERRMPMRRVTMSLMLAWFTLSYGSYGVATWNNVLFEDVGLSNPYLCSFIYALANLPGNIGSILLVEKLGRRRLLASSMALAALSASLFALGAGAGAFTVVTVAALFNAFSVAGWNALDCLSAEAFPTSVRAAGMGLVAASGRLGSIAAQFVNGGLEETAEEGGVVILLAVTSGLMLVGSLASLLLPLETAGRLMDRY